VERLSDQLRAHSELNRRLFWLDGVSDEYLDKVYAASTCLIAASEGEGFGLPLIEAAQREIPIIARDIPVFREVGGDCVFYFSNGKSPKALAEAIKEWLRLYTAGKHPKSDGLPYLTWTESAGKLLDIILGDTLPYKLLTGLSKKNECGNKPPGRKARTQRLERSGAEEAVVSRATSKRTPTFPELE
jgi:glycosyltransferase involved in cell wall biosynthesis